jgi:RHS repeat-associated protein
MSYDVFGRESSRRTMRNGTQIQNMALTYRNDNKISSRHITGINAARIADETFAYDSYGRLSHYTCSGPQYPGDSAGRQIASQQFRHDSLNNLTSVITTFIDGSTDNINRIYNSANPTQLSRIEYSNPPHVRNLSYDPDGNLINDGIHTYRYNELGNLVSVNAGNKVLTSYGYDASGRLTRQNDTDGSPATLHYADEKLIAARQGSATARYLRQEETVQARRLSNTGTELYGSDLGQSIRAMIASDNLTRNLLYAPYGSTEASSDTGSLLERSRPGFNGERFDPLARLYHFGNGHRAYSPELMIFLSPDPLSPFGEGGINPYAYCSGDPINFRDPSGLAQEPGWLAWTLLGIGIVMAAIFFRPALKGIRIAGPTVIRANKIVALGSMVTSLGLKTSSLSLAQIDANNDTDKSRVSNALFAASLALGVLSFASWMGGSATQAKMITRREPLTDIPMQPMGKSVNLSPNPYQPSQTIALPSFKKEFAEQIFSYRRGMQTKRAWALGITSAITRFSLSILTLVASSIYTNRIYSRSPDDDDWWWGWQPNDGEVHGVLENASNADNDFNEQALRLRNSAILEIYAGDDDEDS